MVCGELPDIQLMQYTSSIISILYFFTVLIGNVFV